MGFEVFSLLKVPYQILVELLNDSKFLPECCEALIYLFRLAILYHSILIKTKNFTGNNTTSFLKSGNKYFDKTRLIEFFINAFISPSCVSPFNFKFDHLQSCNNNREAQRNILNNNEL